MKYPIAIEWGDDKTAHGIHIPDLDAVTAGDTIEEAYSAAVEIAHIELENFVNQGKKIPMPSPVESLRLNKDYKDMGWGFIDIDITPYLGKTEKINVTLPSNIIAAIDNYVQKNPVKSRSAFLTEAAIKKLSHA